MEIKELNINELVEYVHNAKIHTKKQIKAIAKSIEDYGFNDPIAIDANNVIIEGHGRLLAAKELGYTKVPTICLNHLNDEQRRAYTLVHNQLTLLTDYDVDILTTELESLNMDDLHNYGFEFEVDEKLLGLVEYIPREEAPAPPSNFKAPLPFQGQKRSFAKEFKEQIAKHYDNSYIFVDLFGGSGLLSRIIKDTLPGAEVYYNDFDNYTERLKQIAITNEIINEVHKLIYDFDKKDNIPHHVEVQIKEYITKRAEMHPNLDIITISSQLVFSADFCDDLADFLNVQFYNRVNGQMYNEEHCKNWTNGLNVTCLDWEHNIDKWKDNPKVVFIADPPYLGTDISQYTNNAYWTFLRFLEVNDKLRGLNSIFFTSDKSNIISLNNFMNKYKFNFFSDPCEIYTQRVALGPEQWYNDYMIINFKNEEEQHE